MHTRFRVSRGDVRLTAESWDSVRSALGQDYSAVTNEGEWISEIHASSVLTSPRRTQVLTALQAAGIPAAHVE